MNQDDELPSSRKKLALRETVVVTFAAAVVLAMLGVGLYFAIYLVRLVIKGQVGP